ncbi:hypothetical protein K9L67_02690, partial [Candidatus Woesearchaeota archaeon]|nr:hypothetical protein [Candidatus Woesearchaeota archaeon]
MGDQRGVDISPEDRLASKILLGESTLKKIDYYLTKSYLSDLDVYNVFKEFFSGYLELNYEFTCKDLLEETKKTFMDTSTKAKLDSLVNKLRIIEYSDESFDQKDLIEILKSLKNIVDTLLEITKNQNKRSFFSKLFGSKTKQNEFVPKEIVVEESLDELNKDEKIEEKENILDEPIINEEEPEKEEYDEPIEIIGDEVKEDFEVHEDWTGEPKKIKKT